MRLTCVAVAVLGVACAEGGSSSGTEDDSAGGSGGAGGFMSSGGSGGEAGAPLLYVHNDETLFRADPSAAELELEQLGDFDCVGDTGQDPAMTDVAVNAQGEVWGVSATAVHRLELQPQMVHCAQTIPLDNPTASFYGLTFAPAGVLHETDEVLVAGNSAGEIWSIDGSGVLAQRGQFGLVPADDGNGHAYDNAGQAWELSGDIVFVAGEDEPIGFATVRDCPNPPSTNGCNLSDTLIELDVPAIPAATTQSITKAVRGLILKDPGCNDPDNATYGSVYGIAAFEDQVIGYARVQMGGFAITIDNADGRACLLQSFTARWAGAGITTLAPVVPPPPK